MSGIYLPSKVPDVMTVVAEHDSLLGIDMYQALELMEPMFEDRVRTGDTSITVHNERMNNEHYGKRDGLDIVGVVIA